MSRVRVLISAFLAGTAAALAAELAAGLLLYAARGLLEAVTLVLAVGLGALGLGFASAPPPGSGVPRSTTLLRRWFFALVAFGAAAAISVAWSVSGALPEAALSRGIMLALLEALPLYAVGALLGTLAAAHPGERIGAAGLLGAAAGIVLQGTVLLVRLEPFSVYLLGIVLLSGAALIHGRYPPVPGPVPEEVRSGSTTSSPDDPQADLFGSPAPPPGASGSHASRSPWHPSETLAADRPPPEAPPIDPLPEHRA